MYSDRPAPCLLADIQVGERGDKKVSVIQNKKWLRMFPQVTHSPPTIILLCLWDAIKQICSPRPPGSDFTTGFSWAISSASHSISSVAFISGSRLNLHKHTQTHYCVIKDFYTVYSLQFMMFKNHICLIDKNVITPCPQTHKFHTFSENLSSLLLTLVHISFWGMSKAVSHDWCL